MMTFPSARVLGACALLVLPATAIAQSRTPTIFSPASRIGTVTVRAAVVGADYGVKPLPLMTVIAIRNNRVDSVAGRTNLDGRLSMKLAPGAYIIHARTPQPVAGRSFKWAVPVVVRAAASVALELTNANASPDSQVVVASAPQPVPASRPVDPRAELIERANAASPGSVNPGSSPTAARPPQTTERERPASPAPTTRPAAPATQPAVSQPAVSQPAVTQPAPTQPAPTQPAPTQPAAAPVAQPVTAPARLTPAPKPAPRAIAPELPRANTSRLFLGFGLNGSTLRSDDLGSDTESGGGLSALLGWGFTRHFALFVDASAARIATPDGDFDLAHFDAGARWHLARRSSALVPFLEVAFSGRAAMEKDVVLTDIDGNPHQGDLTIAGAGVSFGGGLQYFVVPTWALGGAFKWTTGEFSEVRFDNVSVSGFEIDATSARFNLGFTWYPMGGRR